MKVFIIPLIVLFLPSIILFLILFKNESVVIKNKWIVIVLAILGYILFLVIGGLIGLGMTMLKGPEALEYFKMK